MYWTWPPCRPGLVIGRGRVVTCQLPSAVSVSTIIITGIIIMILHVSITSICSKLIYYHYINNHNNHKY